MNGTDSAAGASKHNIRNGKYVVVEIPVRTRKRLSLTTPDAVSPPPTKRPRQDPQEEEAISEHSDARAASPTVTDMMVADREQTSSDYIEDVERDSSCATTSESGFGTDSLLDTMDDQENMTTHTPVVEDIMQLDIKPVFYIPVEDEVVETDNMDVAGETPPDGDTLDDIESTIPVRLLTDFFCYNRKTSEAVSFEALLQDPPSLTIASGIVKPWSEQDTDDDAESESDKDDQEYMHVQLSEISQVNVHFVNFEEKSVDNQIYIRTEFAWYILDKPTERYAGFFLPFWQKHRLASLAVDACLENASLTHDEFAETLLDMDATDSEFDERILGRRLHPNDIEGPETKCYIASVFQRLATEGLSRLGRCPLVRHFAEKENPTTKPRPKRSEDRVISKTSHKKTAKDLPGFTRDTIVSAHIKRQAQALFTQPLVAIGNDDVEGESTRQVRKKMEAVKLRHKDPKSMVWGKETNHKGFFASVSVDGEVYHTGDTVMVNPGIDANSSRQRNASAGASKFPNSLAAQVWFARIEYMYEDDGDKICHFSWYEHSSRTFLQEVGASQSLYKIHECDDSPVASIFKKCTVHILSTVEPEPEDDDGDEYYCGLVWKEDDLSYTDLPTPTEITAALSECESHKPCYSCALHKRRQDYEAIIPIEGGYRRRGVNYHQHDFVYVRPRDRQSVLDIAQIEKIHKNQVTIRDLYRYDDRKAAGDDADPILEERRLCMSETVRCVHPESLEGVCFVELVPVARPERWSAHDIGDHFYVHEGTEEHFSPKNSLKQCDTCTRAHKLALKQTKIFKQSQVPLRNLELFAGAGGLSTGYDKSGFVETKYAIEMDSSAALTFERNHPKAIVYNQNCNLLYQHAVDEQDGKNPAPLRSLRDGKLLPSMPKPGEVDIVTGGLPCQTFSGANSHKDPDDFRTPLMCNMMSILEFYNSDYFQLENVKGLLHHPLNAKLVQTGHSWKLVGGIPHGAVKAIIRMLISLGYQVALKLLQAGQYGSPQARERIIVWGAKRGIKIPGFPEPTHLFLRGGRQNKLQGIGTLLPTIRTQAGDDLDIAAPMNMVSIKKAIGDLPKFDWVSPHAIIPATKKDKEEDRARGLDITQVTVTKETNTKLVEIKHAYAHMPYNGYQFAMRANADENLVADHHTAYFHPGTVERACAVTLKPGADHTSIPRSLWVPRHLRATKPSAHPIFRRDDENGAFSTAMTTVDPTAKGSRVMHPSQKRVFTVRECARAQGFPDDYRFSSVKKTLNAIILDQYKQIGNAVPIPLACALGRALGVALEAQWLENKRAGSPEA